MTFKLFELMEIVNDVMEKLEAENVSMEQMSGVEVAFVERETVGDYTRLGVGVFIPKRDGSGEHRRQPACH